MNEEIAIQINNGVKHYQYLDALRGVAALLVLSVHIPMIINIFNGNGFGFGAFGVELFYILSAFTLFLSSEQRFPVERKPVLKFFVRRFFRIAPLFYIVSAVVFSLNTNLFITFSLIFCFCLVLIKIGLMHQ